MKASSSRSKSPKSRDGNQTYLYKKENSDNRDKNLKTVFNNRSGSNKSEKEKEGKRQNEVITGKNDRKIPEEIKATSLKKSSKRCLMMPQIHG